MRKFLSDKSANIAVTFAVGLLPLMGALGLAVDYSSASQFRSRLQEAADAAALAAMVVKDKTDDDRLAEANRVFWSSLTSYSQTEYATKYGSSPGLTLSLTKTGATAKADWDMPTTFTALVGKGSVAISVTATSVADDPLPICILALNKTSSGGIDLQGGPQLTGINCVVQSNSTSATGLKTQGSSSASATRFCTTGGYSGKFTPLPATNCPPVADPLASLPVPTNLACDFQGISLKKGAWLANPGVYCGGFELQTHADVTLNPGLYVIKDGNLSLRAQSVLRGAGVTIYLYGTNATLNVVAQSGIDISAPKTGAYAGIAIAQNAGSSIGQTSYLNGGGSIKVVGALYFPTQTLEIGGASSIGSTSAYMPVIADKINLRGNGTLTVNADYGAHPFLTGQSA